MPAEAQLCNAYARVLAAVLLPQNRIYGGKAKQQPQLEFGYYNTTSAFKIAVSVLQKYPLSLAVTRSWGAAVLTWHTVVLGAGTPRYLSPWLLPVSCWGVGGHKHLQFALMEQWWWDHDTHHCSALSLWHRVPPACS